MAEISGAKAVVEVGTGAGVSGLWLLSGMRDDGVLTTIDVEPEHQRLAKQAFSEAGIGPSRTRLIGGRAQDVLTRLADESYDLVFVDADKKGNPDYVRAAVGLTRAGGVIVVDNVVRDGRVADAGDTSDAVVGTRATYDVLASEPRLDATALQTVGVKGYDGFAIAVVSEA